MADLCTICQYDVDDDAPDREVTPCNHVFHQGCLDPWRPQNKCPNCGQALDPNLPIQPVQVQHAVQVDPSGYDAPPSSPVAAAAYAGQCPACNQQRTMALLNTHAAAFGQPACVVCAQPCNPTTDYVYVECGHPVHINCAP